MYKLKIGKSVNFCESFAGSMKEAESSGIDSFDFDLALYGYNEKNTLALHAALPEGLEIVKSTPLHLNGVHIPFGENWDYSAENEDVRKNAVAQTVKLFEKINSLKPYCYVLHGSFEPVEDGARAVKLAQLKKSLIELRSETDAIVCVEDLPRTCLLNTSEEMLRVLNECDGIGVCLDSNHFLRETPEDAVLAFGSAIKTTHISDYDFIDERHWMPKKGKINWNAFIGSLEKIGYNGIFNYEVISVTAEQVKKNADELFAEYNALKG